RGFPGTPGRAAVNGPAGTALRAHATVVHGCAMRHTAEALPPQTAGLPGRVPAPHRLGNALEQRLRLASPIRPPRGTAGSTGAAALCPCASFLSPYTPPGGFAARFLLLATRGSGPCRCRGAA